MASVINAEADVVLSTQIAVMKAAAKCLQAGPAYASLQSVKQQRNSNSGAATGEIELKVDAEVQAALLEAAPALRDIIVGAFCNDSQLNTR
jgi:hypothetical protein